MVEVFKTNVTNREDANKVSCLIQKNFVDYKVNFDLEDCDKILRVKCTARKIQPELVIDLLQNYGFNAEVLPDVLAHSQLHLFQNHLELS
jgi:hypothetical protein